MSDETKTATTASAAGSDKTFAQDDVNAIVEQRLARERTKHEAALAAEKSEADKAKAELAATVEKLKQLDAATQTAEERDKLIEEIHAGLLAEVPEDKRGLIPAELTKEQQIRYMQKNKPVLFSVPGDPSAAKPAVTLPASDKKPAAEASGMPSQFKSIGEFARLDPRAYQKWRAENSAK